MYAIRVLCVTSKLMLMMETVFSCMETELHLTVVVIAAGR